MNRLKQSLSSISTPSLPSFGSSSSASERLTDPPLDEPTLASFAARQKLTSALLDACSQLHRALAKERPDPRNTIAHGKTKLPVEWVAEIMAEGADELKDSLVRNSSGEVESYAQVVASVGDMHAQLASLSANYHEQLAGNVLAVLERRAEDFKDWEKALKDAEKKRTTLDAILAKIEKGKKDPAEYEQELDTAQWAYTDSCQRLQRRADQLDEALGEDREAAQQLVAVQLDFARNYVSLLEDCESSLSSSAARSARPRPPLPQRSSANASSSRMARSQSESSIQGGKPVISPTIYSVLGPNRSRGNTVSSVSSEKDRDHSGSSTSKTRSRSGSVLDRLAFGGRSKKKDANGNSGGGVDEEGEEGRPPASPREQNPSSPSRFNPSLPNLPTLGSLKKLSIASNGAGGKYGSLGDAEDYNTAPSSPTRSSAHPPAFRRSQTAPTTASSSNGSLKTPSPTSPGFRRVPPVPSLPAPGPIGRIYRAQWAYLPASGSSHGHGGSAEDESDIEDLALDRGDLVRIEEELTADWWKGAIVSGAGKGRRGMLPSAYVVPHEGETVAGSSARPTTSAGAGNASEARWRSMTADEAPETSSDGHGLDTDTDGDEGLLPEAGEPRWSIDGDESSPFGDDTVSYAHATGRSSRQ
ncbi:hypothetical protein JCM10908_002317 [Rhodotorula pacifica]|uniref:uncharacterized protein n=1 Tax=Rhodotorula pacifica TaxID=1495444 RepID=UPI003178D144